MQHIHILGIAGTFMGSLAQLAKSMGYRVTGSDQAVYPPMSTQLKQADIPFYEGYDPAHLQDKPDLVVVGNVISRGNPVMETVLNLNLPYISGPQWLSDHLLQKKWVLGVSGTHGKTTTASLLTWLLSDNGFEPGYLIGGVPQNFSVSAALGKSDFFVIEADEYDSAFFDKRSKFIHYRPRTLIVNNLEFDHADIFADLAAIQTQFHHLIRTVPSDGLIIAPDADPAIDQVFQKGCWTPVQKLGVAWRAELIAADGSEFDVSFEGDRVGTVKWSMTGQHNVQNGLAALAAARHVGLQPEHGVASLSRFVGVKRRMELLDTVNGVTVYDDFAHHPTAIQTTLAGARAKFPNEKILAVIEPRSNTMKQGIHKDTLKPACDDADAVYWFESGEYPWSIDDAVYASTTSHKTFNNVDAIVAEITEHKQRYPVIIVMSNGSFGGIHQKILAALT